MSLLAQILSRPRTVLTMMVVMVAAGIFTYITIPKEADPDIDVPTFVVNIVQQGISPEDAERLLVKPMETELRGLEGVKELTANASQGVASIVVEFSVGTDLAKASSDLREKVDQVKPELPTAADEPIVREINLSQFPVMVVSLSGDLPERTLYARAKYLQNQIESIASVLEARLSGEREELLEITINPVRLESYNISQEELVRAVTRNNQLIAAGSLDTGGGKFNVKVPGLFETGADVYNLPIKTSDLGVVTLKDVATIKRTFKDATAFGRFNGKPSIVIQVIKRTGTNIIDNNAAVKAKVLSATKDWPSTIKVDFALDQSRFIFEVLGSLEAAIITAIALVMIVCVAALGARSALMVGLAIPTSFMIGFLIMNLLGMTVNMMLMFGLVLTVGMLVDGAIVITEYADRKMAEGLARKDAYILAAERMFWPITSSTATTLAAFLPMLLWPGMSGEFMSYLPITVIIVLTAALVTAMIFLPVLGTLFGKRAGPVDEGVAAIAGNTMFNPDAVPGLTGLYVRTLARIVRYPLTVAAITIAVSFGVFSLFGKYNNGVEFFVDTEPEQALVFVSARGNLSAVEQLALVKQVERIVLGVSGLKSVFTETGGPDNGPEMGTGISDPPVDQVGLITLELEDYGKRRRGKVILQEIRDKTADLPGVKVEVRKREDGPPTGKAVRLEVRGNDFATVEKITKQVRAHVNSMEGLRDVEDTSPLPGIEWELTVDRKEAGRFGANIQSVGTMIQLVTNGVLVGTYRPDDADDEVDIRLFVPRNDRSIDQLDTLRIQTDKGMVPLKNFVTRSPKPRVNTITRKDGEFVMTVKAAAEEGVLGDTKVTELNEWLQAQTWPENIAFRFRGADEEQKESGAFLAKAMVGALFIMFLILVTQFNSFYQAILTLSTIVLSVVGVLIGMMLTGQTFSIIMTGTGIIALAGIVVNNSIVLIDTFNRLRIAGVNAIDAALQACAQRLRPVMLTTITTMLGLLPMAMQFNFNFFDRVIQVGSVTSIWWVQLSTAIICGLGFSTLLTLVLTPSMLALPEVYRETFAKWFGKAKAPAKGEVLRPVAPPAAEAAE